MFNTQCPVENKIKETVYQRLVEYISVEDFPVGCILIPIIAEFKSMIKLRREREVAGPDTYGYEDFVIMDVIENKQEIYIIIIEASVSHFSEASTEAKRTDVDQRFIQCALALHDAYISNNDNKHVYVFMTTGLIWKLIKYDGTSYRMSEEFAAAFRLMKEDKPRL